MQRSSRDVTAVLLTVGEESTARALASIRRQTLPLSGLVVIEGITPVHRAVNAGAERVRTRFFVQVDADMILDEACVEMLRACMNERIGIVLGHLRDPIRQRVLGIKLFRTECFDHAQYRDSMCASTDFTKAVARAGWEVLYALRPEGPTQRQWHTFGEHQPRYDSCGYTFWKYFIEGARCRYRSREGRFVHMLKDLHASAHPAAVVATIALAHGLFLHEERDIVMPRPEHEESIFLAEFLASADAGATALSADCDGEWDPAFTQGYLLGSRLRRECDSSTFVATLQSLRRRTSTASLLNLVGLCHGLFNEDGSADAAAAAFAQLSPLLKHADRWW